jgi:magnesium transporter
MITENIILRKDYSWIDIEHPLEADWNFLQEEFRIPGLLLHDSLRPEHLPKYESTGEGHFFLVRIFDPTSERYALTDQELTNKLAIFIQGDRLISIHSEVIIALRKFYESKDRLEHLRSQQEAVHKLYRLTIRSYEEPILGLQKQYQAFESQILAKDSEALNNEDVYLFRRKLFIIKGILQMTQAALNSSRLFWMNHPELLQDIKEDIEQLYFRLDGLSHNFDQLFALHLSINDQKNNEVMKILTVFASIMLPLTFIASFYGMNFDKLPGTHTTSGFLGALLVMVTLTFTTVWFFFRKGWLRFSI